MRSVYYRLILAMLIKKRFHTSFLGCTDKMVKGSGNGGSEPHVEFKRQEARTGQKHTRM